MRRDELIHALAVYLTTNITRKSAECFSGMRDGIAWATAYKATGVVGHATIDEMEAALKRVLDAEATLPVHYETDIEGAQLSAKAAGGTL